MPKKDEDEAKNIKVKVFEENTINSVPPVESAEDEQPESHSTGEKPENPPSDIGFSTPLPGSESNGEASDADDESTHKDTPFLTFIFAFLGGFLIGALLVGGIFYFKSSVPSGEPTSTPTEETLPTPESTPQTEVKLSEFKLQALNGSGTAGEALKVKGLLEKAGFENVKSGNAQAYDFTETEVAMKSDVPEVVFTEIEKALAGYKVKKVDTLGDSATYDVIITVGSEKSE